MTVGPIEFFAVPVEKKHGEEVFSIQHPEQHLAIYRLGRTENVSQKRPVRNQFGEFELDIFSSRFLCVPSRKISWKEVPNGR